MTHIIVIICHTPHFVPTYSIFHFQLNTDFPSQVFVFTVISPSVTQRLVSQENAFKKNEKPVACFGKTIGSNSSFTPIENNYRSLDGEVQIKVTVHYGLWAKCTEL